MLLNTVKIQMILNRQAPVRLTIVGSIEYPIPRITPLETSIVPQRKYKVQI